MSNYSVITKTTLLSVEALNSLKQAKKQKKTKNKQTKKNFKKTQLNILLEFGIENLAVAKKKKKRKKDRNMHVTSFTRLLCCIQFPKPSHQLDDA